MEMGTLSKNSVLFFFFEVQKLFALLQLEGLMLQKNIANANLHL